jgi:hypothetical protein
MVTRREGASPAKLLFQSFGDRDMERQDISSQELPKCRNAEMRNGKIDMRPCACNPTVLDTWKYDRRAIVALHS